MICSGRVRAHLYSLKVPDLDIEIRIQQWDIKHYWIGIGDVMKFKLLIISENYDKIVPNF